MSYIVVIYILYIKHKSMKNRKLKLKSVHAAVIVEVFYD